ncbi:maleylpyruvate isomerase family mycothiol-dependent enzyme [Streptomyces sp. ODS28]|uniref:maleylpyruvate isomerase family mycothiol-dependent enzyme n=1 Tax=Streptomyces sp. ODS28 TaxID=3136688 RepID=UPI0031EF9FB2
MGTVREMAGDERRELAAFLGELAPGEWEAPTLCAEWSVREVVAHVVSYDELSARDLVRRLAQARFSTDRSNALGVAAYAGREPDELLALLRAHPEPRGLPAAFGGMIALVDGFVHHQDIRRALGRPRDVPGARLQRVLTLALRAPVLPARRNAKGLRLTATDVDWQRGAGPEVRGPGEALLMALAGRSATLDELSGSGASTLAGRVTTGTGAR